MERRSFLKKTAAVVTAATIAPKMLSANEFIAMSPEEVGNDFKIISDETRDGVRYISATPSQIVCSKRIDIEINTSDGTIRHCEFTRGCPGNSLGLCKLIKGMEVSKVIDTLIGNPCGNRQTSCPDQLARVLAACVK